MWVLEIWGPGGQMQTILAIRPAPAGVLWGELLLCYLRTHSHQESAMNRSKPQLHLCRGFLASLTPYSAMEEHQ